MGSAQQLDRKRVAQLEEEGDVAADYLEELLDIADLDGDIEIDVEHDRASVAIIADDSASIRHLVGREGEVLEALQELARLAVQAKTGERSRLMLDVAGYRAGRREELTALANDAIAKVQSTGRAIALEPLNAFERKVVHDVVTDAGLTSESHGVDPDRYIEISPAQ
ncbi:protein jag [Jonesia quinghaiensis]|uniref:Jag family protein n=1 Tax=Jonesia quinghaiensis TaxID=262806 RepID=UPI000402CE95|nr:R3H domain-containing nucleic acid-binding protein [Jonesia quinghaiensis]